MTEGKKRTVIFQRRLPMDLKLISPIINKEVTSNTCIKSGAEEEMLNHMKKGYILMGDMNLELSELGLGHDCCELIKYERSLLRKVMY